MAARRKGSGGARGGTRGGARGSARSKAQREFVSEAEEILERMRGDLAELGDRAPDAEPEPELVNQLFRSAHSLKGLSGMFGLDAMSDLAHHLEDVLDRMRLGRASADATALQLLEESVATFASMLGQLSDPDARAQGERTARDLVERIAAWRRAPEPERASLEGLALDPSVLRALTEYEEHRLRENVRRGRRIHLVEADFEILTFEEGLAELAAAIREVGEVVSTLPSPGDTPESKIRFSLLAAADLDGPSLAERLEIPAGDVRTVRPSEGAAESEGAAAPAGDPEPAPVEAADGAAAESAEPVSGEAAAPEPTASAPDIESLKSISETVRVDIRKLDELMTMVGELVIQRTALARLADKLAAEPGTRRLANELGKIHKALDRRLQDLQAGVLEVRMVPLRQVFEKLSRVVRRLRRDAGKDVHLEVRGADTELDKLIVEELVDPLMHVVRNAFDHAIESAEERRASGKPAEGTIRLEAFQRGNDVVIEVADDGRGIDADAVFARAAERGVVARDAELTRKEKLDLIFAAGLSTRTEVTETSGRGVGMDVVRSNIASLGGLVDVESEPGQGSTVALTLPITLAIIQAILVGVGEQRFAVPLNAVRETLLVDPAEIQRSEGRPMLNLRGEALPLRRLADEFRIPAEEGDAKPYAVVVGAGDARVGLLVDRLHGQQDTVIKPIQGPVRSVRGIAGAAELPDQGALLVLDVSALVEDALRGREGA